MAEKKNIFREKLDGYIEGGPRSSDWEAMNSKIEAHPALNKSKSRGALLLWMVTGLSIAVLIAGGLAGYFINEQYTKSEGEKSTPQTEISKNPDEPGESSSHNVNNESDRAAGTEQTAETVKRDEAAGELEEYSTSRKESSLKLKSESARSKGSDPDKPSADSENAGSIATETLEKAEKESIPEKKTPKKPDARISERGLVEAEIEKQVEENALDENETPSDRHTREISDSRAGERAVSPESRETPADNPDAGRIAEAVSREYQTPFSMTPESAISVLTEKNNHLAARSAEDEEFSEAFNPARNSRFKISNINVGGTYTALPDNSIYGYGIGADVDFRSGRLLLNTGVYFTRFHHRSQPFELSRVDTQLTQQVQTRNELQRDSSWVLTGPNQGYYEYDTAYVTIRDTMTDERYDTIRMAGTRKIRLAYAEMPVAVGYRFYFNRLGLDLYGGVVLHQLLSRRSAESVEVVKEFGTDVIFRPEFRYMFSVNKAVYLRTGLRYPLTPSASIRNREVYGDIQLGVSFNW